MVLVPLWRLSLVEMCKGSLVGEVEKPPLDVRLEEGMNARMRVRNSCTERQLSRESKRRTRIENQISI
jgi:hypothetical protein